MGQSLISGQHLASLINSFADSLEELKGKNLLKYKNPEGNEVEWRTPLF